MKEPDSIGDIMARGRAKSGLWHDDVPTEDAKLNGEDFIRAAASTYKDLSGLDIGPKEEAAVRKLMADGYSLDGNALTAAEAERLGIAVHNYIAEARFWGLDQGDGGLSPDETKIARIKADLAEAERAQSERGPQTGTAAYEAAARKAESQPAPSREDAARALHRAGRAVSATYFGSKPAETAGPKRCLWQRGLADFAHLGSHTEQPPGTLDRRDLSPGPDTPWRDPFWSTGDSK